MSKHRMTNEARMSDVEKSTCVHRHLGFLHPFVIGYFVIRPSALRAAASFAGNNLLPLQANHIRTVHDK